MSKGENWVEPQDKVDIEFENYKRTLMKYRLWQTGTGKLVPIDQMSTERLYSLIKSLEGEEQTRFADFIPLLSEVLLQRIDKEKENT